MGWGWAGGVNGVRSPPPVRPSIRVCCLAFPGMGSTTIRATATQSPRTHPGASRRPRFLACIIRTTATQLLSTSIHIPSPRTHPGASTWVSNTQSLYIKHHTRTQAQVVGRGLAPPVERRVRLGHLRGEGLGPVALAPAAVVCVCVGWGGEGIDLRVCLFVCVCGVSGWLVVVVFGWGGGGG